jgi:cell filamentation protein, protein adenylyltransferase
MFCATCRTFATAACLRSSRRASPICAAKADLFCLPEHIESYGAEIFGKLAEENRLRGLDRESFIDRLAHYLGDVNALHPFRDGNGRAQRAFFAQLASDVGYRLDWQLVDPQRNTDASVAAMQGNEAPMRELLAGITTANI